MTESKSVGVKVSRTHRLTDNGLTLSLRGWVSLLMDLPMYDGAKKIIEQFLFKLKADRPHPPDYSTHRQTPWTDNDNAEPLISTIVGQKIYSDRRKDRHYQVPYLPHYAVGNKPRACSTMIGNFWNLSICKEVYQTDCAAAKQLLKYTKVTWVQKVHFVTHSDGILYQLPESSICSRMHVDCFHVFALIYDRQLSLHLSEYVNQEKNLGDILPKSNLFNSSCIWSLQTCQDRCKGAVGTILRKNEAEV